MGRDRAKEKIQARRKAKSDRKEAKIEEREKAAENQRQGSSKGAEENAKENSWASSPLVKAALNPDWNEIVMFDFWMMVKENPETDIFSPNAAGVTLIHVLAYRGWESVLVDVIKTIETCEGYDAKSLQKSLDCMTWDGSTPLMMAVEHGHATTALLLLSKGASPIVEDKAGFTSFCRVLANFNVDGMSSGLEKVMVESLQKILIMLDKDNGNRSNEFNIESYIKKRIKIATNPVWDNSVFFVERLHRIGKGFILFILKRLHNGCEILLNNKILSQLSTAGYRNMHLADYTFVICIIIFEILVYVEDLPAFYPQFVNSFVGDGVADFCLKAMKRVYPVISPDLEGSGSLDGDSDQLSSHSRSCSEVSSQRCFKDTPESLAYDCDKQLPLDRNVPLASLMSIIQLVDAPGMDVWFSKNFPAVVNCYENIVDKNPCHVGMIPSTLGGEHVTRTNKKAILLKMLVSQEHWTSPYIAMPLPKNTKKLLPLLNTPVSEITEDVEPFVKKVTEDVEPIVKKITEDVEPFVKKVTEDVEPIVKKITNSLSHTTVPKRECGQSLGETPKAVISLKCPTKRSASDASSKEVDLSPPRLQKLEKKFTSQKPINKDRISHQRSKTVSAEKMPKINLENRSDAVVKPVGKKDTTPVVSDIMEDGEPFLKKVTNSSSQTTLTTRKCGLVEPLKDVCPEFVPEVEQSSSDEDEVDLEYTRPEKLRKTSVYLKSINDQTFHQRQRRHIYVGQMFPGKKVGYQSLIRTVKPEGKKKDDTIKKILSETKEKILAEPKEQIPAETTEKMLLEAVKKCEDCKRRIVAIQTQKTGKRLRQKEWE